MAVAQADISGRQSNELLFLLLINVHGQSHKIECKIWRRGVEKACSSPPLRKEPGPLQLGLFIQQLALLLTWL